MSGSFLSTKLCSAILLCGVIAGCATQNNGAMTQDAFNKALADADTVEQGGDHDHAIALYQKLTAVDPTREEPWGRIAQIQLTQQHYGQAIVAAQEALQRDPKDRQAKAVLVVSGLRIATQSVGELRQDAQLAGDAKSDAQALAKQLRDSVGADVLFPPEAKSDDANVKKRRYVRRVVRRPAASAPADASAPAPAPAPAAQSAQAGAAKDPFGALR